MGTDELHTELLTDLLGRIKYFTSFDGSTRVRTEQTDFAQSNSSRPMIARGGGYSFVAASFGKDILVQNMTELNRFIKFDPDQLTLKVESGMTVLKLMHWAIERGLYLPVMPGYPLISVGGCVASDVHGKNPFQDGTFCEWVKELKVFHPTFGYQTLSREKNAELFALTCGGFGLTGIITEVTLKLLRLPSSLVATRKTPVESLSVAALSLIKDQSEFAYSWHDGASLSNQFGKGLLITGNWAKQSANEIRSENFRFKPMTAQRRALLPFSIWNSYTALVANQLFRLKNKTSERPKVQSIFEATFPFAQSRHYHALFGRPGFSEAQILISEERALTFIQSFESLVRREAPPTLMISLKRFKGIQKSLSMTGSGILIAINSCRNSRTLNFLNQVDELMLAEQGQPNLSKDSRLSMKVVEASLPNYKNFKQALHNYDPARVFKSDLSMRIGL